MVSRAVDRLTKVHGVHLADVIEIINTAVTPQKALLVQRLFVVTLVAFWEAFHEALCREGLAVRPSPANSAGRAIERFHNPEPKKITQLYKDVLGIPDITESWWGNVRNQTGRTPDESRGIIQRMVNLRHDIAHGAWGLPLSANDCQNFLGTVLHLAIRTDEAVQAHIAASGWAKLQNTRESNNA